MRFFVCVKQVPSTGEQRLDPVTGTVIREGIPSILNPFDAYAVEEALRLRARVGGEITAVSMGVPSVRETLRRTLALGVGRAILLTDRAFAGADTLATSRALAQAIEKAGGADLVLCGRMATDGDTAQVGPMLAERLGVPHVTDVTRVEEISSNEIIVRRLTDDGYQRLRVKLPALVTVMKEINVPRLPSLSGVLRAQKAEVETWNAEDIGAARETVGLAGSATRVVKTARPGAAAKCETLPDAAALLALLRQENLIGGECRA